MIRATMGKYSATIRRTLIISLFLVLYPNVSSTLVEATADHRVWKGANQSEQGICRGTIGECMGAAGDQGEFDMDSESSRRILAAPPARKKYIDFRPIVKGDFVPCSIRGASYYNCKVGGQANQYTRACNAIARCRID